MFELRHGLRKINCSNVQKLGFRVLRVEHHTSRLGAATLGPVIAGALFSESTAGADQRLYSSDSHSLQKRWAASSSAGAKVSLS
jgi:hypothetical protein